MTIQIQYGEHLSGEIDPITETDIYTFVGGIGDVITLVAGDSITGSIEGRVQIYDPDFELIEDTWSDTIVNINRTLEKTGTYTVSITDLNFDETGTYNISLTRLFDANNPPTDIDLDDNQVDENQTVGTIVGSFSTVDPDEETDFIYSLVNGVGDTDNNAFTIQNNQLLIAEEFDLETQSSYSIRVQTDDGKGGTFEKIFNIECFLTGTRILTTRGEIAVENLQIGDKVQTADGKLELIKWIGRQTVEPNRVKNPLRGYPVLIKAGALGNDIPHRDLYVSPDHALLVEGLLINAGALVNDVSIVKTEPTETFTYYHIELENHALLVAEGAAVESYLPQKENRDEYDNCAEYEQLYPHGSNLMLWPMDYPRVSSRNKVPRFVRKQLIKIASQGDSFKISKTA